MIPSPTPFAARSGGDQQKSLLVHSVHLPQRSTHAPSSLSPSSSVWDPDYGRINAVIVTQSVVGGLGVLLCLLSLVHIYGHSRDKRSISARLVLGMLISNLVYAAVDLVPTQLRRTSGTECGYFVIGPRVTPPHTHTTHTPHTHHTHTTPQRFLF